MQEMPPKSMAAKARAANLRKASAARKTSAKTASTVAAEDADVAEPPQKKQRGDFPPISAENKQKIHAYIASQSSTPAEKPAQSASNIETASVAKSVTQAQSTAESSTGTLSALHANPRLVLPLRDGLPFPTEALISDAKSGNEDYAALVAKIKEFQTQPKPDRTAECFIHFPSGTGKGYGRLRSADYGFAEPMGDEPYDVGIAGLKEETRVDLQVLGAVGGVGEGVKGVSGTAVLATSDCAVASAHGVFKLRTVPVWKNGDAEIYEGYVAFNVEYGLYARNDHRNGTSSSFAFWAIRSREGGRVEGRKCGAFG
ncbi:hypothetical protein LshimejAT787_0309120 [Lyophyllum shimeji]|uniref:Uncharacterized protein n=1 Tax=Lyophyllum shimeji TaxID=47721 RepID=A0A9P3UJ76_LYOSH|nr:hypothetical protein LshimejAT787_0309120 [Lyophyllum shimeji]